MVEKTKCILQAIFAGKAVSETYLNQAADWADALTRRESRGPGDTDNALRRVADRTGIPYRALWSLRYRRPKCPVKIRGIFAMVREAYINECLKQAKKLEQEAQIAKAISGPLHPSVVEAEALVASTYEGLEGED